MGDVIANLQDGPVIFISWYSCLFYVPLLPWIMAGLCEQHNTVEENLKLPRQKGNQAHVGNIPGYVRKDIAVSILAFPLVHLLWGRQWPRHGTQVAPRRGPCGEELRPFTRSHTSLPQFEFTYMSHLAGQGGQPIKFQISAAPDDTLTMTSWETSSQSHLPKLLLNSWPTETVRENTFIVVLSH